METLIHPEGDLSTAPPFTPEEEARFKTLLQTAEAQFGSMDADGPPQSAEAGKAADGGLADMLATPQGFEDLWPGHVYLPPKIRELEIIFPALDEIGELYREGSTASRFASINKTVDILRMVARKVDDSTLPPTFEEVTAEDIKATFEPDELAQLIPHILDKQGLVVKGGTPGSKNPIGARSFERFAATIPDTESSTAES